MNLDTRDPAVPLNYAVFLNRLGKVSHCDGGDGSSGDDDGDDGDDGRVDGDDDDRSGTRGSPADEEV